MTTVHEAGAVAASGAGERRGGSVVAALGDAWTAIRGAHEHVPPVILATGPRRYHPRGRRRTIAYFRCLGWWEWQPGEPPGWRDACEAFDQAIEEEDLSAALSASATKMWIELSDIRRQAATCVDEVFITFDGLRGPGDILAILLHEAAHGIATHRGVKDTSRQGRYHNGRFKVIAEEVGLEVERDPRYGWSSTTLRAATAASYSDTLAKLSDARTDQEALLLLATESPRTKGHKTTSLTCDCGQRWRTGDRSYVAHAAICGVCGTGALDPPVAG